MLSLIHEQSAFVEGCGRGTKAGSCHMRARFARGTAP